MSRAPAQWSGQVEVGRGGVARPVACRPYTRAIYVQSNPQAVHVLVREDGPGGRILDTITFTGADWDRAVAAVVTLRNGAA